MNPHNLPQERKVLDLGYVILTDVMGDDRTPAQTARTSFRNRKERTAEEDARLTDYLIRNRHTTPLEFCQARFYMKLPLFVAAQLVRHRTSSINQISYRYVKAAREYYIPDFDRMQKQSTDNKQGSGEEIISDPHSAAWLMRRSNETAFDHYERLLETGLATELCRTVLPVATYTEWYWQCDLHNLLHMLRLRLDPHAQHEIRVYAEAMLDLIRPIFPTIVESWERALGRGQPAEVKRAVYVLLGWHQRNGTKFSKHVFTCTEDYEAFKAGYDCVPENDEYGKPSLFVWPDDKCKMRDTENDVWYPWPPTDIRNDILKDDPTAASVFEKEAK
jgi:thymidylate synthase (FAD)